MFHSFIGQFVLIHIHNLFIILILLLVFSCFVFYFSSPPQCVSSRLPPPSSDARSLSEALHFLPWVSWFSLLSSPQGLAFCKVCLILCIWLNMKMLHARMIAINVWAKFIMKWIYQHCVMCFLFEGKSLTYSYFPYQISMFEGLIAHVCHNSDYDVNASSWLF